MVRSVAGAGGPLPPQPDPLHASTGRLRGETFGTPSHPLKTEVAVRVRFGDCVFDSGTRELLREGRPVVLSPKAVALLAALLESRPRALGKPELHRRLWPDTFVAGSSLPRLVNEVRRAIGDAADRPRFVRTLHRFGYAFSGPAVDVAGDLRRPTGCWLRWGGERIPVPEGESLLGRGADSLVPLVEGRVSRRHARLVVTEGRATLEDLGSRHGTFLNRRRIDAPADLRSGDRIGVGSVELVFVGSQDADRPTE
jgi:DNA-binding winged helix-turn-helix (wHTH) protein